MPADEVAFGRFRLDLVRRRLTRDGAPVQLGGRAFDLLSALALANGRVVTKDELMCQVWPGAVVDENNIQVHISALRRALDEGGGGPGYVRTIQGQGYRLVGIKAAAQPSTTNGYVGESAFIPERPAIAILPFANLS